MDLVRPIATGVKKSQKMPKVGFGPKWRPKLLPVPVFISDSHSTPTTWSKTSIISRGSDGYFSRYLGPKFENLKTFYFKRVTRICHLQIFDILWTLGSPITVPKVFMIVYSFRT